MLLGAIAVARGPRRPEGREQLEDTRPLFRPERGQALGELFAADGARDPSALPRATCQPRSRVRGDLVAADGRCEPLFAGRVFHYLDCHAGPTVAARLMAFVPESVLRPVRAAAARGWWERPMTQASGMSAEGGGGPS